MILDAFSSFITTNLPIYNLIHLSSCTSLVRSLPYSLIISNLMLFDFCHFIMFLLKIYENLLTRKTYSAIISKSIGEMAELV